MDKVNFLSLLPDNSFFPLVRTWCKLNFAHQCMFLYIYPEQLVATGILNVFIQLYSWMLVRALDDGPMSYVTDEYNQMSKMAKGGKESTLENELHAREVKHSAVRW